MNTYGRVKAHLRTILDETGHSNFAIYPGPDLPDIPGPHVVCTPYGGPGVILDGAGDDRSWQFRVVGQQNNYESAESAANAIDIAMLSHYSSQIEGVWVSEIRRVGGAPSPLMTDDADRTHFVCSYIVSVELALTN